jgi:hypothetical protein
LLRRSSSQLRVGLFAAIFMFLKKKHKGFSLPSLTQRIPMTHRFFTEL